MALQDKNRELEDDLQKRNTEKNQLVLKFNQLKKNYDTLKFAEEQRIKESESLSYQTHNANTRINDLKNKLDVERRSLEEMQREFEAKYNSILRDKEHLEAENEDMKWQIEKNIAAAQ